MRRTTVSYWAGLVLAAYLVNRSCSATRKPASEPPAKPAPPAATRTWSPEEMSENPEGYLVWADLQLKSQIESREKALAALSSRRTEIERRQKELLGNLEEIENFQDRLETAVRRAEDEDRWPVKIGGRNFERAKAAKVLEQTRRFVTDRKPLAGDYAKALGKMTERSAAWRDEIAAVGRLRERLALDLERVHLQQALPELDALKKTEAEIAHYARLLAAIADDASEEGLAKGDAPAPLNLNSLLDG